MSAIHPSFDSPAAPLSSSNFSTGLRKVRLSDRELLERVQRIPVPNGPLNLQTLSSQHGWNHKRSSDVYMRMLHAHSTISPVLTRQCQVVTGGEMQVRVLELMSLLCAPTERESNALLRALYGSRFIYSSLLHMISSSERGSLSPIATFTTGQQLTVRTVSFVRNGLVNPLKRRPPSAPDSRILMHEHGHSGAKNEQCCYIELLTPTQEGFTLVFCSLDAAEVTAGKAPPERVVALHPLTGWLTAQPTQDDPESLRFTFQAAFTGNLPGGCDFQVAHNRLLFFAKRVCRLEKVVSYYGGKYSIHRALALDEFVREITLARALLICAATPLPMVALVFVQELIPLQDLHEGWQANYGLWIRTAVMVGISTHAIVVQMTYLIDDLTVSVSQMLQLYVLVPSIVVGLAMVVTEYLVFPIPFFVLLAMPMFFFLLVISLRVVLGSRGMNHILTHREQFIRCIRFVCAQASTIVIFPAYEMFFHASQGTKYQVLVILLLPVIKVAAKNVVLHFAKSLEDMRSLVLCKMLLWMVITLSFRVIHFGVDFKFEFIRRGFPRLWTPMG
ncbi:hypothetical protein PC122_g4308 [Phytophthora cactorum]|nr:hypothetical protein PC122_g4308 [Phytophthora cactorum]